MSEAFDLSAFDYLSEAQDQGLAVDLLGPDGKTPMGVKLGIAGPDSKKTLEATDLLSDQLLRQERKTPLTAAEARERERRFYAMITLWWEPAVLKFDGKEHRCTPGSTVKLYEKYPWVLDQVKARNVKRSDFITRSETTSENVSSDGTPESDSGSQP